MNKFIDKAVFKSRARVLQHLGDQLIGTSRLAVFELVKNAYDADATRVVVTINGIGTKSPSISIEDNGVGMSLATIQEIWLVIAHDHKEKQLKKCQRTMRGRLPLGSKGLGRLSVHKLGNKIEMITRAADAQEVVVRINWNSMISKEYLDDAEFDIEARQPLHFAGSSTGTLIRINDLRDLHWTRGEVRRLYRQITSISSPFSSGSHDDFSATLEVPDVPHWIDRLPDPAEILKRAPWYYKFHFDGSSFRYRYTFNKIPGIVRETRTVDADDMPLLVPPAQIDDDDPLLGGIVPGLAPRQVVGNNSMLSGIGPVSGELFVFDFSQKLTKYMSEMRLVKDFLAENGGIRVYRDGIRVYDYGERNNDWLGLDLWKMHNLKKGLDKNLVVGHVSLNQEVSFELIEKSNREGFIESDAYERLRRIVIGAIEPLQREREKDYNAIRELMGEAHDPEFKSIMEPVAKIREIVKSNQLSGQINQLLDGIEFEYASMKERLLAAGISGISLALVFHEIEQGIHSLYRSLKDNQSTAVFTNQVKELMGLLDGFSDLLRKKARKPVDLKFIIKRATELSAIRFRHHNVLVECPLLNEDERSVMVSCSFGLTLGAITNIIDNAIYWMRTRWPDDDDQGGRKIFIDIDVNFHNGPAIVVSDTGPGFQDSPSELVHPFYSRRPEGMGMGLYYTSMVMELNDGELIFPSRSELDVPGYYDGATVALRFPRLEA